MEAPRDIDIHKREKRRTRIEQILKGSEIVEEDKKLILEYVNYRTIESGICLLRQEKIISVLLIYGRFLGKSYRDATKEDIIHITQEVYAMPSNRRTGGKLADSTKNGYVKVLKKFFIWLKQEEHPKETDWLKPPRPMINRLDKQQRLYWEDAEALSRAADNKRDFLLPQILLDSGLRIEELLTLRRKNIEFIEVGKTPKGKTIYSARLHIQKSKTLTRSPEIYKSVPALIDWMDNMPLKTPDTPLFINIRRNNNALNYQVMLHTMKKLKERSGLKKSVNPHFFRKSSCSLAMDAGLGDAQIDVRFGWRVGSRVKMLYGFPDEQKSNDAFLATAGVKRPYNKTPERKIEIQLCPYCDTLNPPGRDFCTNKDCKLPINPERINELKFAEATTLQGLQEKMQKMEEAMAAMKR
jgi:integrase